jgi:hypothetical protein
MRNTNKILAIGTLGLIIGMSVPQVFAQMPDCQMILDTLAICVTHHWQMGQLHNQGIYNSLLSKVDAAVAANDRGQIETAINILNAFIHQVNAQSGKQIDVDAASHMITHASAAINHLQNSTQDS